jgi:homoserine kinase
VSLKTHSLTLAEEVVVPGTLAKQGCGFDTLGVAVQLYLRARIVDVREDGGSRLEVVRSTPAVSGPNAIERGFAAVAALTGRRAPSVRVEVSSDIPLAAGLGSSAAATVAGLRIFERVTGDVPGRTLLKAATDVEGHADNAAPSLFGGLNSVVQIDGGEPLALRWSWPPVLRLVVATPGATLSTTKARAALSGQLSRADAVFNLQRALLLVHALQSGDVAWLREAVRDRWHQQARSPLVPVLGEALALDDPSVAGVFLSGAGPSIAAIVHGDAARVEDRLTSLYSRAGVPAVVRTLAVHDAHGPSAPSPAAAVSGHIPDALASARGRTSV